MGLWDFVGDTIEGYAQARAYQKHTALIRHRLAEEDAILKKISEERGHEVFDPELPPDFFEHWVLPDEVVERPKGYKFNVQTFFAEKSQFLSGYVDPETGSSAADIVSRASKDSGIHPKLLLSALQREQGAVRTRRALSQHKMDWIMGVGCYEDGRRLKQYKGFARQITSAGKIYRKHYDNWFEGKVVSVNFGRKTLIPRNAGTYSLYRYNPQTSGALLTRKIWLGFFGS